MLGAPAAFAIAVLIVSIAPPTHVVLRADAFGGLAGLVAVIWGVMARAPIVR